MNLTCKLFEVSQKFGSHTAIIANVQEVQYSKLLERADAVAIGLKNVGINEGDKVAIILPNSLEFILIFFALQRINATAVPIEAIYNVRTYREIFEECKPKALITNSYLLLNSLVFEKFILDRKLIVVNRDQWIKENFPRSVDFDNLLKNQKPSRITSHAKVPNADFLAAIIYTFRGFGYPVGVELTSENLYHGVLALQNVAADAEKFLAVLPFSHIFGLLATVLVPLFRGKTIVIPKHNSSEDIFDAIEKYKVDFMIGVPTLYFYLVNSIIEGKHDLSSVRYAISGGNFLSPKVHSLFEKKLGMPFYQGYGLTEALVTSCNLREGNRPGSLGIAGAGVKIKILDESHNKEAGSGRKGVVAISGPTVMRGYYKKKTETESVHKDSWLLTGDYGKMDKKGYLYFCGLKKRIAKVSGHNVDLPEIERIIGSHPSIDKVVAYAKNDMIWGQKIGIDVYTKVKITKDEILAFCQRNFATFQIPKVIRIKK